MKKILVVTDNGILYCKFKELLENNFPEYKDLFDFKKSYSSKIIKKYETGIEGLEELDVKNEIDFILNRYDKVISLHCKQIFPERLVKTIPCINIHPGYNPINRGWYPQVFAIKNQTVIGATIHEMDILIDNGKIIARKQIPIYSQDTSKEVYERVLSLEIELIKDHLHSIVSGDYKTILPEDSGIFHTRQEFKQLCEIDLDQKATYREVINHLRALSHGDYYNAYFYDEDNQKIFIKIDLTKSHE